MKDDKTNWLEVFGLRDDDESIALIVVALLTLFLGFFWLRGFGDSAQPEQISAGGDEAVVAEAGDLTLEGDYNNTGTLDLKGKGTPNGTVDIYLDDSQIGSAEVDTLGNWDFSTRVRKSGDHVVYAREQDIITGKPLQSGAYAFSALVGGAAAAAVEDAEPTAVVEEEEVEATAVATSAPEPEPEPIAPSLNPALNASNSEFDPAAMTNIDGSAEPNSSVTVFSDDLELGSAETDDNGNWLLALPFGAFKVGEHILKVASTDNPELVSESASIFVNDPIPSTFKEESMNIEVNAGFYNIVGLGHPNWQSAVSVNNGEFQFVGVNANGEWTLPDYDFSTPGVYNLEVRSVDTDGSLLAQSQTNTVTMLDAAAAVAPVAPAPEEPTAEPEAPAQTDIIDLMAQDGRFTTLLTAINSFGLTDIFRNQGPFTIFAPTDAALAALPDGAVGDYLANGDAITKVLEAHVVSGNLLAGDVLAATTLQTVGGGTLSVNPETATVNGAQIIETDKVASNGVVHVIDSLILPQEEFTPPTIDDQGVPSFVGPLLTIVGTAQPDTVLLVELNGEVFGFTFVEPDGTWLVSDNVDANTYEITAYTYEKAESGGLLRGISNTVNLIVE